MFASLQLVPNQPTRRYSDQLSLVTHDLGGKGAPALCTHGAGLCGSMLSPLKSAALVAFLAFGAVAVLTNAASAALI